MAWDSATSSTLRHTKVQSKPSLSFVPTDFLTLHLPSTLCAYFNHNVHPLSPPLQSSFIPIPHPLPPPHILLPYHHPKYKKCCLSARSLGHPNQDHPQRIPQTCAFLRLLLTSCSGCSLIFIPNTGNVICLQGHRCVQIKIILRGFNHGPTGSQTCAPNPGLQFSICTTHPCLL